jgi:hypothetical protein
MDSSVSPERKVYGRVPEPPPRFAAFIGIPLDPVLALAFLFSLETNVTRFCPILFPTTVEEFCILKPFVFKEPTGVVVVVVFFRLNSKEERKKDRLTKKDRRTKKTDEKKSKIEEKKEKQFLHKNKEKKVIH